jgi:hypothetical protein
MSISNKKKPMIKYTNRDYNSIKSDLIDYAKRNYSDTFRDFGEAGFGSFMIDAISYIGDSLSFYTDYSANESFPDTALEYNNVIRHGKVLGYKFKNNPSSYGIATFYITVPAKSYGLGPDTNYLPMLLKGSEFSSNSGNAFILNENIDFSNSNNEIVVAQVDDTTGIPTSYAIRAQGRVISGELSIQTIDVGDYTPFLKLELNGSSIAEVLSVTDGEGHSYYEVDYLSQDIIYKGIPNRNSDKDTVRSILKPIVVPRRFIVEQEEKKTFIQFGYGSTEEIKLSSIADPSNIVLQVYGKDYYTDTSFDPSKLIATDKFGVVPSQTTLTIITRNNSSENVNAAVGSISNVNSSMWDFANEGTLNLNTTADIRASLEVSNEEPIIGDVSLPSSDEIRKRIFDSYASQNRAVTKQDYISAVYRMPPEFGSIKRTNIFQDQDSFKRNLNCYVVSEDASGILTTTNRTIKDNLKTHLQKFKMVNDTIDILDARIVNIGIEFSAIAIDEKNKYSALSEGIDLLKQFYANKMDIGENFSITNIFSILKQAPSISDVVDVKLVNKRSSTYSDTYYNIETHLSADGRELFCEDDVVFEVRYINFDIKGSIK